MQFGYFYAQFMTKKSLLFFFLLLFVASSGYSQGKKYENLGDFDKKKIHFGFSLGLNGANFLSDVDISKVDSLVNVDILTQNGFSLGVVTDFHITPELNLRVIFPTLSFGDRRIEYLFLKSGGGLTSIVKPVESTYLDVPVNLKYRSIRYQNFAAYVLAGGMYSYDLISQKDVINSNTNLADMVIKLNNHNFYYQIGFGFDFFLEYFKFSPELKLSYGLNNVALKDGSILSEPFTSLKSKIFLISLTFEG